MLAIPARDGTALGARLVAPPRATGLPVLLYLHGGGFTIGSSATHDILCRNWRVWRAAWWCRSTTAWRRSTAFLRRRMTPGTRSPGWRPTPTIWEQTPSALLWAVTARAARWRQLVPSWRATPACRWRCSFYLPGCAAHQDTASHAKFSRPGARRGGHFLGLWPVRARTV
jgi:acetyl esterase